MKPFSRTIVVLAWLVSVAAGQLARAVDDPLPSWNDGAPKQAIVSFVGNVTNEGSPDFVPPAQRIATFDNDGTLWCEQPMYFQMIFAFDRIKATAGEHPEWNDTAPFKFVLDGDIKQFGATGQKGLLDVLATTHAGMTVEDFHSIVRKWMRTARHPRFHRPYDQCIYQPMHELLAYLRRNKFKTFIVSGGGIEFMRPWVGKVYGIPPQQVVGSSGIVKYELKDSKPELIKESKVEFIDDGPGKPVGINRFIGRRPIAAFGNSDGDYEMLEWTTAGSGPRLGMIVHHTDADREYAYDYPSHVGQLKRALEAAPKHGWVVIDMKSDWRTVFKEN